MLASQRQSEIEKLLKANGAVTTTELTERFGTSLETVRRDLLAMEKAGVLSRVHGGAVAVTEMMVYQPLEKRDRGTEQFAADQQQRERTENDYSSHFISLRFGVDPDIE
jgi:DeoR family fructose operon transcriptional repressor